MTSVRPEWGGVKVPLGLGSSAGRVESGGGFLTQAFLGCLQGEARSVGWEPFCEMPRVPHPLVPIS